MNSADGWGDDVYQPDASEVQDDAGLLDAEDTLENDGVADPSTGAGPLRSGPGPWSTTA
ncbi:hypothetical protein SHKM778_58770 [Streptomyces sp. KM77-8]|uniref:Uncharacterized protein n=1 Tax=Streptomyces haneummycinicus TaxID=3074435 RepID=A0AAT9HQM6_9ACTN